MADYIDKCECHIHSLKRTGDNQYIAQYGDVKCTAIYNPFAGTYYVDDKYGVLSRGGKERGNER